MKANRFTKIFYKFHDFLKQNKELRKTIRNNKVDLLHIATSGKQGFVRDYKFIKYAHKYGVKCVLHFHFGRTPSLLENKTIKETKNMLKACNVADSIILIDEQSFNSLSKIYDKCFYVKNPVQIFKKEYSKERKVISYIGTLNRNKGITDLIKAYNLISDNFKDWSLNLIGPIDDNYVEEFNSLSKASSIVAKGQLEREKVLEEIQNSAFTILPSYTEGMPYSILESMSMGIPVIATNVGSIPQLLEEEQMVNPGDIQSLSLKLKSFIEDESKREKYSKLSFIKIAESFDVNIIREELEKVWCKLW